MKIALVVPGGVDRSGQERVIPVILSIIEHLSRRHQVTVFAFRQYPEPCTYPLLGAEVHNMGEESIRRSIPAGLGSLKLTQSLVSKMRSTGLFDVIHAFWGGSTGVAATFAGWRLGVPSVLSLAGGELVGIPDIKYGSQLSLRGRMQVFFSTRAASRVTVASRTMKDLASKLGISAVEIPLGVDLRRFGPQKQMASEPPWRLLHIGSLNKVKDQDTLLKVLRIAINVEPEIHLDIIGEDTLNGEVQRRCTKLGLDNAVTFHGFVPYDDIHKFFQRADLLLVTSRHEAGPLVVLEAAALGVPTAGTAVGHVAEFSPDKAFAVPVRNAEALAKGVLGLLRDGKRRSGMGLAAHEWVKAHSIDWTIQRFEGIYLDLLASR